ncbi:MAG: prolyl oligopeptidase family serine peptidase [Opitutaceae bacterium]|nr:prolyl oligopeptidase family serine peptidase [Opitutaceae bacterium]
MSPRHLFSRFLLLGLLLLGAKAVCATAAEPSAPASSEVFFAPPSFMLPKLSPDGSKLCALTRFDDRHYALTLINLASKQAKTVVRAEELTVINYWWKGDDLLLAMLEGEGGRRIFRSVDLKNDKLHPLDNLEVYRLIEFMADLPDDPEQMLFRLTPAGAPEVMKVNLRTGRETAVEAAPADILSWCLNRAGEALAGYGYDGGKERWFIVWRTTAGGKWQRRDSPRQQPLDVVPIAVAPDGRRILALDYTRGATGSIGYLDPATGRTEELFTAAEIEPSRLLTWGDNPQVLGVSYDGSQSTVRYFDPEFGRAQAWIEAALPGTRWTVSSVSRDQSKAVIYAETDRTAGVFCLADFNTKKISVLRSSLSGLAPSSLAASRFFTFPSSDNLTITGRITLPSGITKPPLILFIGPDLNGPRSEPALDRLAQFFARRGYAFARIDQRGTHGFGRTFAEAGDYQFATGMVHDFTAAKAWLAAQGWIDPERVAVVGARAGGFVAFQLALTPGFARVLVNLETPTHAHEWPLSIFLTSQRDPEEVLKTIGGTKAFVAHKNNANPLNLLGKLTTASFHYYSEFRNGVDLTPRTPDARTLEGPLKKLGKPFEVISAKPISRKISVQTTDWRQTAECYEAVAAFLARQL